MSDKALRRYYADRAHEYDRVYLKPERQADLRAIEDWLAERDSEGNTWQLRRLADGSTHRVLKNFPSEEELRDAVSGIATGVHLREWEFFWALEYRVPGR